MNGHVIVRHCNVARSCRHVHHSILSHDQLRAASLIGRNAVMWRSSLLNDAHVGGRPCDIAMLHSHVTVWHCNVAQSRDCVKLQCHKYCNVCVQLPTNLLYEMHAFGRLNAVGIVHKMRNVELTADDCYVFHSVYINAISNTQYCQ